jgi:SSS family solute:Na+ symporter
MPAGLRGLVAAGLLAALMSSLASVFNSCSTLFTVDIYKKLKPHAPEAELLKTGRIATAIVVVLGIAWIPIMQNISGVLYEYLQSVQSYIAPPITAVFLLGIFHRRITGMAAIATLGLGLLVGFVRIVLEINALSLAQGTILHTIATTNFLTFAAWFFLFSVILCIGVSLFTAPPDPARIKGLTFSTLTAGQKAANRASYSAWDVVVSLVVVGIVAYVMVSFTG